ncbi:MAG: response regulator [Thaumarchaeota archaeon]|jgi:DNA-binding NtrC family response regulator|nr:response regulator [Candidatus Geocrenenecus arthurdayi]
MIKVLVVDDDEVISQNLKTILEEFGYISDTAYSGEEALRKIRESYYDVALIDLLLPDMDGLQLLLEVKKVSPTTAIIIITAFGTIPNAVEAIKRGASDYITKPFRIDDLLTTIKKVIEEQRMIYEADTEMPFILSHPIRRSVISLLAKHRKMRFIDIARAIGVEDPPKLSFHLKILRDAGLVVQESDKLYTLTEKGIRAMRGMRTKT